MRLLREGDKDRDSVWNIPPEFFCSACTIDGKPRERYRSADAAAGGSPSVIKGECNECHKSLPVKLCIQAGTTNHMFCTGYAECRESAYRIKPAVCYMQESCGPPIYPSNHVCQTRKPTDIRESVLLGEVFICRGAVQLQDAGWALTGRVQQLPKSTRKKTLLGVLAARLSTTATRPAETANWKRHKGACFRMDEIPNVGVADDEEIASAYG